MFEDLFLFTLIRNKSWNSPLKDWSTIIAASYLCLERKRAFYSLIWPKKFVIGTIILY